MFFLKVFVQSKDYLDALQELILHLGPVPIHEGTRDTIAYLIHLDEAEELKEKLFQNDLLTPQLIIFQQVLDHLHQLPNHGVKLIYLLRIQNLIRVVQSS